MKRAIVLGILVCVFGRWASAQEEPAAPPKPASAPTATRAADAAVPLAYFGDKAITAGEIDQFIRRPTSGPAIPDEILQRQRQQGVAQYLTRMLYESYAADHPGTVKDEDVENLVKKYEAQVSQSGQKLEEVLKRYGMTMTEFRKRLMAEAVHTKLTEKANDEKEIAAFYDKHKSDFDGTQFKAKHILILVDPFFAKPEDDAKAKATLVQVKKDIAAGKTTFDEAVAKYSEDPSRAQGLPPITRYGMMVEPFAAAAAALKPDEISDPVKSRYGYHLIQLISREPGQAQPFEQAKDAIRNLLTGEASEKMIADQRAKHPIRVVMPYVKPPRRELPPRTTQPTTRLTTRPAMRPTTRPFVRPTTQASNPANEEMRRKMLEQLKARQAQIQSSQPAASPRARPAKAGDGK